LRKNIQELALICHHCGAQKGQSQAGKKVAVGALALFVGRRNIRNLDMPTISMFYGILILMYFYDNKKHNAPHIHAEYAEFEASISIDDGAILSGGLPNAKLKLVQAWIEIHREDLLANWKLAVKGESVFKVDPLR